MSRISKGLLLGLALLLVTSAFAANKASMQVNDPFSVAGKQLKTGGYTVTWEGRGPAIQLNILEGKKLVATIPARLVDLENAPESGSTVVKMDGGNRVLSEIRFSGKKYAVAVGDEAGGAASGASSVR